MIKKQLVAFFRSFGWLAILIVIVDQITKWAAYLNDVSLTIIPGFFRLDYTRNTGAAWSILSSVPWLLAIISFVAGIAMIGFFFYKKASLNQWWKAALMLMIGGTWGNFIDRAFYQEGVIDFLAFNIFGYPFPTFNVADMALVVGTISLIIIMLIEDHVKAKHAK
ncbi:MAG TPA: signal peptidase II [Bacilli bacterium]|nr:signal peptidase II [Bacilli bacterium]